MCTTHTVHFSQSDSEFSDLPRTALVVVGRRSDARGAGEQGLARARAGKRAGRSRTGRQ